MSLIPFVLQVLADWLEKRRQQRHIAAVQSAWGEAARALGLERPTRLPEGVELSGVADGLSIRFHDSAPDGRTLLTAFLAESPPSIWLDPAVAAPAERDWRQVLPSARTGDPQFDRAAHTMGDEALACSLLDSPTRQAFLAALSDGYWVDGGVVTKRYGETLLSPHALQLAIRDARRLVDRLVPAADTPQRLATLVEEDPIPGARARCLEVLVARYPDQARPVVQRALHDKAPEVQLAAALIAGDGGTHTLLELAKPPTPEETRLRAITALADRVSAAALAHLLGRTAASHLAPPRVLVAAIEALEKSVRRAPAADVPGAEAGLLQALANPDVDVRIVAAKALGHMGTVVAVPPLKAAIDAHRFDRAFDRVARQAVAEIQSRVPGASPGQLSIAGGQEGQLSLPDAEPGQVSLAGDDD